MISILSLVQTNICFALEIDKGEIYHQNNVSFQHNKNLIVCKPAYLAIVTILVFTTQRL